LVPQGEILDHKFCAGEEGRSHRGEQQQTEAKHEATQDPSSLGNVKESRSDLVLATDTSCLDKIWSKLGASLQALRTLH